MRRLPPWLVLLIAALLLPACAAPAPTPTPTLPPSPTPQPTATPQPPTASPTLTAAFTPSPTPDILLMKTRRLLTAFAASVEETPDGGYLLTLPSGEKVELQNVEAQNLTMEPQNWVENYNGGKILYEGKTEAGQEWRVVKLESGEMALMYDNTFSYLSDIFPFTLYSYNPKTEKFESYVEPPGNGVAENVHVHKDESGKWVDDQGNEVALASFDEKFIKHYHLTGIDLQRITIHNWEVQALVDQDGREWTVKEGKLMIDGQEVAVPEVVDEATPISLAKRAEDGKWYVMDERGLARWVINDGKVEKYNRPVMAFDYTQDSQWEGWYPGFPEKMAEIKQRLEEEGVDYSKMKPVVIGGEKFQTGLLGMERMTSRRLGFKEGDGIVWIPGLVVEMFDQKNGTAIQLRVIMVLPQPFEDQMVGFGVFNWSKVQDRIYTVEIGDDWMSYEDSGVYPEELRRLWLEADKNLPIVYGADFMGPEYGLDNKTKYQEVGDKWLEGKGFPIIRRLRLGLFVKP